MATAQDISSDLQGREHVEARFGGFGGQGIILSGMILGRAVTVHAGRNAVMSQSYGPESRGGACMAEVVIADGEIAYPRVLEPDLIVMMSQEAYGKYAAGRSAESILIVDQDLVEVDEEREAGRLVLKTPSTRMAEELGRRIIANIVMLGFVCGATNVVDMDIMREAVLASVPPGTEKLNLSAVEAGYEHALKLLAEIRSGGGA
ncbi:MAG: pyruvate ferredoxin oxidoreductase [SAR202 cluster bacterium]|jgi:2-oxoglutarate ferredoxin oxidoreductase subunit gamma|nr:pyruvate ferredoxin oxidoreductase [Chloroflexota bacterium]MDP6420517.1 2-oxoacid:acceptor oxidoreductase family protein [SAR202 cluster bacterium]HAL48584.1 pyruvate ferredoxin oxidoreductase [Dehalococcoidia bacterium]MDP6664009.1 2-oxoacid:acceptor oxidoreductase family protein [SAR202 cluster bacterium]MDP6799182.1 2-oxoacid:acceptor oxidoreductase family protein [SAR202 cluster bacterium]|tara:strand:+ start:8775 stop:9386 length:612 start_codon:yes stop_codon:yes gene_type:complete